MEHYDMEKILKNEVKEKTITNEYEKYVLEGDSEKALNIYVRQMGLRPSKYIQSKGRTSVF